MNMSLACTASATEIHLCRSSSNVPRLTPAIVFWNTTKPSRFARFWQGAQSLAPATQNNIWTSTSAPYPSVFYTFDLEMCFAPQQRALFRHLNFQKWSEHEAFCTFWLRNVLRATTACTFSTSQLLKMVRTWIFFWAFSLANVLRTTTACNFPSLIWPAGSAPAALASLLFDPPEPNIIGKIQWIATFLPFRAPESSFFWISLLWSSSFFSSLLWLFPSLLFICPFFGSLTSKFPWIILFPTSLCGVLVFRLDPAALLRPPPPRRTHHYSSLTHSLITHSLPHSLTHYSLTHPLTHSLPHSPHSLTHGGAAEPSGGAAARVGAAGPRLAVVWQVQYRELPGCVSRGRRSTQSLLEELRRAWPPLGRGCLSRGRCSTQSFLAAFRVAGAVHRASWTSCGARGRRWAAAAFLVAGAVLRLLAAFRVAGAVQRASSRRVAAAGPRLPFSWQAQYTELPGCVSRGRRSTQSLLAELRRAWPPLGRGCLSRGRRSTQSFLAAFRVAGAVHRASWRSCGARGRRWAAAAFLVAGAVHRASWLRFAWQAQYTEPPAGAAARVAAAGPRLPFSWQVQYTELPGCVSRGRRSWQSLLAELRREWPQLGPRLPFAWQAPLIIHPSSRTTYHISLTTSHLPFSQLTHHLSHPTHHSPLITTPHLTPHLSLSHHTLSHPNSSQLRLSHLTHHSSTSSS